MKKSIPVALIISLITQLFVFQTNALSSSLLLQLPPILAASHRSGSSSSVVNDNVIIIGENSAADIISTSPNTGINGEIAVLVSGETATILENGYIFSLLPGADNRFPFGITGEIVGLLDNDQGRKIVILQNSSYADVIKEAHVDLDNITLDASNFVGVIAPSAVQSASEAPVAMAAKNVSGGNFYSFRNGAVVVGASNEKMKINSTVEDADIKLDDVSLNMKIDLAEMGVDASKMFPIDAETSVGFVVSGSLKNINISQKMTFNTNIDVDSPVDLIFDANIDSELEADVKFNGKGAVKFGYFSQAWKEVEDLSFSKLTITGLSSSDKTGKFPLVGLVWSIPCPEGCLMTTGKTQTPLRLAKELGIIIWVSLRLDGEFSIDGALKFAHINPAKLSLGIGGTIPDSDFYINSSLERINNADRLLELMQLDGTFNANSNIGIAIDADIFIGTIRIANAGIDLVARPEIQVTGNIGYGTDTLDSLWSWNGNACFRSTIGAGAILRGAVKFGFEIDATSWLTISDEYEYRTQIPKEEDMSKSGWHGAWYTVVGEDICTANPAITQTPMSGPPGTTFTQSGIGFTPESTGVMYIRKPDGTEYDPVLCPMDEWGNFSTDYIAPSDKAPGNYTWRVIDGPTGVSSNEVTYIIEGTEVDPTIAQTPMSGPPGTTFTQWGTGFTPNSTGTMHFQKPDGTEYEPLQQVMDDTGHFEIPYPSPTDKEPGNYTWWVIDGPTGISSNQVTYTIQSPEVNPTIAQTPMSAPAGTTFAQWGTGFTPNSTGTMHFRKPDGTEYPTKQQAMDSTGHFDIPYPSPVDKEPGNYTWWVIDGPTGISSNQVTYTIQSPEVNPTIAQTPMSAPAGTTFAQWGTGFTPNSTGTMHFRKPDGTEYEPLQQVMDGIGHFDISYPSPTNKEPGNYTWWVIDGPTGISSNQVTYTIE
ncbi:MAG: hypothetical protein ACL93V_16560 [Candidatus Electrothrix sp. YB6]